MGDSLFASALLPRTSGLPQPVVANPLAATTDALRAAGGLYDLRQAQAKEAAGQEFLKSIDPATGQPNQAQLLRNLANNPATAMYAQESAQRGQTLDADTYKLHTQRLSQANDAIGSLIGRFPQGIPQDAAHAAIDQEVSTGLITPAEGEQLKTRFGSDPRQNTVTASQMYQHNMNLGQQLDWNYGVSGTATGPGGVAIGTKQNVRTGAMAATPQQGVQLGLGPEGQAQFQQWLNDKVEYPDRDNPGATKVGTRQQMFQDLGIDPRLVYPGGLGAGVPPAPAPTTTPPTTTPARTAAGATSPNKPAPTPVATPAPSIGTPIKAPSAADIETQKAGAAMGNQLTARAAQVPDNRANLGSMLADAEKLDSMGAGTAREAYLNSFFQKWTGTGLLGNATPEQVAAAEKFNKIGSIMVGAQMAALGASDARQQLMIGATPHLDLSKLGNTEIIHMLQGNEDAIAAKSQAWEEWKLTHGSGSYSQFQNELNKHFDLRVFQQQYMGPDEIKSLRKQLESQGKDKKFLEDVAYARSQHWIP